MRRVIVTGLLLLVVALEGGCMGINGEDNLQQKLLRRMENKYDTRFTIVESQYSEYPLMNVLVATVSPIDNPDVQFNARIDSIGRCSDNYHEALFHYHIVEYYSVLCEQDYIQDYDIVVYGLDTTDDLTHLTVEQYIEDHQFQVHLNVQFYDGKTDDQYAEEIYSLLSDIDAFPEPVHMVNIYLSDNILIFCNNLYNLNVDGAQGLSYYNHDFLVNEVRDNRAGSIVRNSIREDYSDDV